MKRKQILAILLTMSVLTGIFTTQSYAQGLEEQGTLSPVNEGNISAQLDQMYGWQSFAQNLELEYTTIQGEKAAGFHVKPEWRWKRFEGVFDLAFFQNPWNDDKWQWGMPRPGIIPDLPNFIDSFAYQGDCLQLQYQKIEDIDYGYGLLINDYHPFNPYRGFLLNGTPSETTHLSYVAFGEIFYWAPFEKNDYASLQALRIDQSVTTAGLHWQLGLTGIRDGYDGLSSRQFPTEGLSYDLSLNNVIWCAPFWESARFTNFGKADMFGVKGRLGLVSYQIGEFYTQGKFVANYFGGRYEDLKWNSYNDLGKAGLLSLDSVDAASRNGTMAQLWLEVNPWLNLSALYIDDIESPMAYRFKGKIERLGLEYGFSLYDQKRNVYNYDWFIKDDDGSWSYLCHYYRDLDGKSRYDFELGYKF